MFICSGSKMCTAVFEMKEILDAFLMLLKEVEAFLLD